MNRLILLAAALPLAACAEAQAGPEPDPAEVERLIAALEAGEAPAPRGGAGIAKAERVVAAAERADPEKLGAAAERLLAR